MPSSTTRSETISLSTLRGEVTGLAIGPEDPGYDEARTVFIGGIDRRPAVIVRVADARDVATVIRLARETGLELAIRSGGHSSIGHGVSEGGIVLAHESPSPQVAHDRDQLGPVVKRPEPPDRERVGAAHVPTLRPLGGTCSPADAAPKRAWSSA